MQQSFVGPHLGARLCRIHTHHAVQYMYSSRYACMHVCMCASTFVQLRLGGGDVRRYSKCSRFSAVTYASHSAVRDVPDMIVVEKSWQSSITPLLAWLGQAKGGLSCSSVSQLLLLTINITLITINHQPIRTQTDNSPASISTLDHAVVLPIILITKSSHSLTHP
jgi:hypothetical protein